MCNDLMAVLLAPLCQPSGYALPENNLAATDGSSRRGAHPNCRPLSRQIRCNRVVRIVGWRIDCRGSTSNVGGPIVEAGINDLRATPASPSSPLSPSDPRCHPLLLLAELLSPIRHIPLLLKPGQSPPGSHGRNFYADQAMRCWDANPSPG